MKFAWIFIAAAAIAGCSGGNGTDSNPAAQTAPSNQPEVPRPSNKPAPKAETAMMPNSSVSPKGPSNAPAAATDAAGYTAVQAVLTTNCVKCHSGPVPKYKMDLTSYANVMKGGSEGPVIVAGDVDGSLLDKAIHGKGAKQMPPKGNLSDADIKTIEDWIKAGAKG